MKCAVIDLGSNTIKLSVYNIHDDKTFELLFSKKEMAGLVNYINNGVMSEDGINKATAVIIDFKNLLTHFGDCDIHVFATASLRNIQNTDYAVRTIYKRTGIHINVISGEEEAMLGYSGACSDTSITIDAMFDIGGGSTEIVEIQDGRISDAQSLTIGSLSLFKNHVSKIWPKKSEIRDIKCHIIEELSKTTLPQNTRAICGVGGTARAVLDIIHAYKNPSNPDRIITWEDLSIIYEILTSRNNNAKKLILNSCPDRIHTIIPGTILMKTLCEALGCSKIFISKYGVREGYLCRRLMENTTLPIHKTEN